MPWWLDPGPHDEECRGRYRLRVDGVPEFMTAAADIDSVLGTSPRSPCMPFYNQNLALNLRAQYVLAFGPTDTFLLTTAFEHLCLHNNTLFIRTGWDRNRIDLSDLKGAIWGHDGPVFALKENTYYVGETMSFCQHRRVHMHCFLQRLWYRLRVIGRFFLRRIFPRRHQPPNPEDLEHSDSIEYLEDSWDF